MNPNNLNALADLLQNDVDGIRQLVTTNFFDANILKREKEVLIKCEDLEKVDALIKFLEKIS